MGLALSFLLVVPAADAAVLDRIAAIVNNEVVTLSEVQEEGLPEIQKVMKDYVESEQEAQLAKVYHKYLDQLIVRRLQLQEAKKDQLAPSAGEVNATIEDLKRKNGFKTDDELRRALLTEGLTLEAFRRRVAEQLALGRVTTREVRNKIIVDDREIRAFYEAHRDKFKRTPEVTLRHILITLPARASLEGPVQARAKAEEALAKLRSGADFAEVAKAYSEGPTAQTGGLLGTMRRGEMAPEIEEQAFTLPVGQVSGIIQTNTGLNIIKVESRKDDPLVPVDEVRDKIREALLDEKFAAKQKEWVEDLKRKASIQIRLREARDQARKP
jgi:peptidyl-prolyl cis-trans isomerase SurA